MHDLVAVSLGHAKGAEHGAMRGIEQGCDLVGAAAFQYIESQQGHVWVPGSWDDCFSHRFLATALRPNDG
jgi:hypothetical protein